MGEPAHPALRTERQRQSPGSCPEREKVPWVWKPPLFLTQPEEDSFLLHPQVVVFNFFFFRLGRSQGPESERQETTGPYKPPLSG